MSSMPRKICETRKKVVSFKQKKAYNHQSVMQYHTPAPNGMFNTFLTWHASTFPSVYPAQSILGVIPPLYMQELLHVFGLIMGTGASFSVSGDWTERENKRDAFNWFCKLWLECCSSIVPASGWMYPHPEIQHWVPPGRFWLYWGKHTGRIVSRRKKRPKSIFFVVIFNFFVSCNEIMFWEKKISPINTREWVDMQNTRMSVETHWPLL